MQSARLVSIQVGRPTLYHDAAGAWATGFFKQPAIGSVRLSTTGAEGDGQADTVHHGGPDKAVLAYSAGHYPRWCDELGIDFPHGGFGENLTIVGLDETTVCIGDVYRIGPAVLQVSQPRQPCWKLGRRWQRPELVKQVLATNRCGWYLRVLTEGEVAAGESVLLVERPNPEWTIVAANDVMYRRLPAATLAAKTRELADLPVLSQSWTTELKSRL
jgi:MOSC domain-containing protein YiiM